MLQFPVELFMMRHYVLALGFFTPMILVMTLLASPGDAPAVMTDRAVETLIGAACGMAVSWALRRPAVTLVGA